MKKTYILFLAAVATVSSCGMIAGSVSSDNGQRFQDGIYNSTPSFRTKEEKAASKTETDALVAKTKESQIYLFGDKKDTVMIPQNMSARIQFNPEAGGTVVTVGEDPYGWWNGYTYTPYSIGSSWYWSRHYSPYWGAWGYRPWRYYGFYDPWYYGGFYDPWYYGGYGYYGHWYGGFYDPWYCGGWYDPWYCGGYWGWYSPWHHHHGWYDPHHHHHRPSHIVGGGHRDHVYHGLRAHTERRSVVSTGSSSSRSTVRTTGGTLRGGMSVGNTRSRASVTRRTGGSTTTRAASSTNYRRPSHSGSTGSSGSYTRGSSQNSQSYTRGSSYDRSSGYSSSSGGSSYSRSNSSRSSSYGGSSSSYSRSSSSHGGGSSGYSRGSSSGGGSYSRSSSGGYRR